MSATYVPTADAIAPGGAMSLTVPVDGDANTAASIVAPLEDLADTVKTIVNWHAQQAPIQNLIVNGRFDFWQRGVLASPLTYRTYVADRWACKSAGPFTISRQNAPVSAASPATSRYVLRHLRAVGSDTNPGVVNQEIDRDLVRLVRSRQVRLTFWVRMGVSFSGTLKARITTNLGAETQIDELSTGYPTPTTIKLDQTVPVATYWQRLSYMTAGTLEDNMTCAAVHFVHTPSGTAAGSNDWFEIGEVMLTREGILQPSTIPESFIFAGNDIVGELALCEKYFEKSYKLDTAPGTAADYSVTSVMLDAVKQAEPIRYRVRKNTAIASVPVVALYNLDGTSGTWTGTWASDIAATAASRESLLSVGPTTLSEATAGSHFYGHWTSDAEFY
jgi:hypothetical protein